MRKLMLVLTVLTTTLYMATSAPAGSSAVTFSVSPPAPVLGDSLVFSGCGWNATNPSGSQNTLTVLIQQPDDSYAGETVFVDKSGCFTSAAFSYSVLQTGYYTVFAFQKYRQAALSFTVSG